MRRRTSFLLLLALVLASLMVTRTGRRPAIDSAPGAGASIQQPADARLSEAGRGTDARRQQVEPGAVRTPTEDVRMESAGVPAGRLFAYVRPAEAAPLDAALPAPSQQIHYVRVNAAWIAGKDSPFWQRPGAGRVRLPLPDGGEIAVVLERSEMRGADRFVSRGWIEGRPESTAVFGYDRGFLHASIDDPVLGSFVLRAATAEISQFYRVDPSRVAPCGGDRRPTPAAAPANRLMGSRPASGAAGGEIDGSRPPATAAAENPQRAEVHVLLLYTPAVQSNLAGGDRAAAVRSAFEASIEKTNLILERSEVTARVKLVGVAETTYDETLSTREKVQDDALTALYQTEDGRMDEIHALRDRLGADVVLLALNRFGESSGLAFLLDTPGDLSNPLFAFGIVQYSNVTGTTVVPHELGHLFGCAHDPTNALSGHGAFPYSYGYRFVGADGNWYRDIMAYPQVKDAVTGHYVGPSATELSYYSNPRITAAAPVSRPVGHVDDADNARTVEQNAFGVSTYRLQTQAAANSGTLINVATRAYVGSGDEVLIGGFVVGGTAPKRMLVRAIGPTLGRFGVGPVLSDPVLSVVASGGTPLAGNDNWGTVTSGSGSAEMAAAATQIGAFALPAGSLDAAVLTTLPPGAYTAVVEGAEGATGFGLVEAYEVGRDGGRIVNLATRGYADNAGREMIGGFVVQGTGTATKRVLVRVLGPTLERAPFNMTGTLFDPCLELRGGDGRLLIENDDWSSGARIIRGERDDFQPLVRYYSEQQISSTGFAPTNRREPCVMVDLPPGNYTVVVKPFELRDPDPELDQPAQPGVGIVEVYEVDR